MLLDEDLQAIDLGTALDIGPGIWRMRNGHNAVIEERLEIPYVSGSGEKKIYKIWSGYCQQCGDAMTWTLAGRYAAIGAHRNDIMQKKNPAAGESDGAVSTPG